MTRVVHALCLMVAGSAMAASTPGDPCGVEGASCFEIHTTPGCEDASCCVPICGSDPFCCETEWDYLCRQQAVEQCGPAVPVNDTAGSATFVAGPVFGYSTVGATDSDEVLLPEGCGGVFGNEIHRDVWFELRAPVTGTMLFSTCPIEGSGAYSEFDSILLARDPSTLEVLVCNDESSDCGGYAEITVPVAAGERFLVQVGGHDEWVGFGAIAVLSSGKPARAPANDACTGATEIALVSVEAFDLLGATPSEPTGCGDGLDDVWFAVAPPAEGGVLSVTACSEDGPVHLEVFTACGESLGCNEIADCSTTGGFDIGVNQELSILVRVAATSGAEGTLTTWFTPEPSCPGDLSGDGLVDAIDLGIVLGYWGLPEADLNGDGFTDAIDLGIVLGDWGLCN